MNDERIQYLQSEISRLENSLTEKKQELSRFQNQKTIETETVSDSSIGINNFSSPEIKIALFRSLFRGRDDVFAKRFESKKTGKAGYQPVCSNEWVQNICRKPAITCASCDQRAFQSISDEAIRNHLAGEIPSGRSGGIGSPFVMGVYPLLLNETCWFLALDFDKEQWELDARSYIETCRKEQVSASLERSRSGNGGHIWIFFDHPIQASKARMLGSVLTTKTLDRRPEIGLDSFDRFFPNQDTLPKGGFGNLIALPLQKKARTKNHSIFLNDEMEPFPDQWQYLASIKRLSESMIDNIINEAVTKKEILPVSFNDTFSFNEGEDEAVPWKAVTQSAWPVINELLPTSIDLVLADQIYLDHKGLPPILRNRVLRLASFSNPEFYRSQAMRLPTWNKPRILYCYEFFQKYIGLPIGCLDDLLSLLFFYNIKPEIHDERIHGRRLEVNFLGELRSEQKEASKAILAYNTGILSATTAFGKTVVALSIIAERKVNTLILVHRTQLMDQWVERITQFLDIPKNQIGQFGGNKKKRTGILDVAVMQSVSRNGITADWLGGVRSNNR